MWMDPGALEKGSSERGVWNFPTARWDRVPEVIKKKGGR